MSEVVERQPKPPFNLPAVILFTLSTLGALSVLPWYAWTHGFGAGAWAFFAFCTAATGLSITAGYHRLWAHRAYSAHWSLRLFYMLFGAMAFQNSAMVWCSMHRVHHKHVDDVDLDPYSIRRGFWFAHLGWMLRNYPSGEIDFSNSPDLEKDRLVAFQHRHYLAIALGMNFGFPLLVGAACGDPWGFLLLGGLLRLVINHHCTFFINSMAHYWGRRPYTVQNTARDNDILALFTFGEGYHNFHHLFQWDYRNGIRWWQYDPTKWWIAGFSALGLAHSLKRVPEFKIQRAMLQRQFDRTQARLQRCGSPRRMAVLQKLLEQELEAFAATVNEWTHLQGERFDAARKQLADQWENSEARRRLQVLEEALRLQRQRVRLLRLQTA
ncbi:MAG: fatty acid desaturase [Nevskia sp.]|nr:fatty acid desaturase [Nevskia sp.]